MVTSEKSIGSSPALLSMVSDTSARPERRPLRGPGEDDVLHLGRAHRARPLGAEHPGHGVDDVGLAAAVRADHDRDPGLELEGGRRRRTT